MIFFGGKHLNFRIAIGIVGCMARNMANRLAELQGGTGEVCIAFTPQVNDWNGCSRIELQVVDIKPGSAVALG